MVGYARDGREAVELAISLEPDVVLMDLAGRPHDLLQFRARLAH